MEEGEERKGEEVEEVERKGEREERLIINHRRPL